MRQETITNIVGCRWAAVLLAGLLMASDAFAQQVLYSYTAGRALGPVLATTAPPSGSYRGEYVVSMSQNSTGGDVELRAWKDSTTGLVEIGNAVIGPVNAYALATLDATRVVSAFTDSTGTLDVGVWVAGGEDPYPPLYLEGQGSASSSGTLEPIPYFGAPLGVSITALSPTEVATAATDPSGNLRVQTWSINAAGGVALQSTAIGGPISYPYIVAINANQVVTVDDTDLENGFVTASSKREVIVWQINSDGGITRQGSLSVPDNGITTGLANGPLGGFLGGGYSVITATINESATGSYLGAEVTSWNISQTGGQVTQGTITSTKNYFFDSLDSAAIAWSPNLAPFSATLGGPVSGEIALELWGTQNDSWYPIGDGVYDPSAGVPTVTAFGSGIAVAAEGTDGGSHGYFVVAFIDSSGNLRLQVCSAPYA